MIQSITVRWKNELREQLVALLQVDGKSMGNFVLDIRDDAQLNCNLEELSKLVHDIISVEDFDVVELSDFSSVALLYRTKKKGLHNLVVKPAPFIRRLTITQSKRENNKALVKYNGRSSHHGILAMAFLFFLAIVMGAAFYSSRGRTRR